MTGVAAWLSTSSCPSASSTSPMWKQPSAPATSRTSVATAPSTPMLPRRLTAPWRALQPRAPFLNMRGWSQRLPSTSTSPSILTTITRSTVRETQTQVRTTNLLPMLTTTMETMASSITRGRSRRRGMSTKLGWAALQNPVVCRQPQLPSQRHGRTCFGLLATSSAGLITPSSKPMWVALLRCDKDGNSPWTLLSAAFSAPELSSEPSPATACFSVLNEACCANQEVPGHCWLTLHRAAGRGGGARAGMGAALLSSSAHPDIPGCAGIPGFPGQETRGGTACAPQDMVPGD